MDKYHIIEQRNGFRITVHDLHDRFAQHRLKDFAWRITEELAEASEAMRLHPGTNHGIEEIADAYHFLVELSLMVGWTADIFTEQLQLGPSDRLDQMFKYAYQTRDQTRPTVYEAFWFFTETLGITMNRLKNKPWKTTHMMTDTTKFHTSLAQTHCAFMVLCASLELTAGDLYRIYFQKSEVNKFRQRTNY